MGNTVFLIGNGFNRFLEQCYSADDDLCRDLDGVCSLWGRFEECLNRLLVTAGDSVRATASEASYTTERLAQLLYDMIQFAEGLAALEQSTDLASAAGIPSCHLACKEALNAHMGESVFAVVKQFIDSETRGLYSRIFQNPPVGLAELQNLLASASARVALFTTNYDGLVDMVLGFEAFRGEKTGFRLVDGFGKRTDPDAVYFRDDAPDLLSQWGVRGHLHGSYKFLAQRAQNGETLYRKLTSAELDHFDALSEGCQPVVVFDAPNRKRGRLDGFRILRQYLASFEDHLAQAQNLVLFGISLKDDPHLLQCIRSRWVQPANSSGKTLCIIDAEPEAVWNRVDPVATRGDPHYSVQLLTPDPDWTFEDLREALATILTSQGD